MISCFLRYSQPFVLGSVDVFKYLPESLRPEYRWLIAGPARSGTAIHTDPRGTSTWNLVLKGKKRCVYPLIMMIFLNQ